MWSLLNTRLLIQALTLLNIFPKITTTSDLFSYWSKIRSPSQWQLKRLLPVIALFRVGLHFGNACQVKKLLSNHNITQVIGTREQRHWNKQSEANFPTLEYCCLSDAARFRKVLLWVLEKTETQGPLQICLLCKVFSKKRRSSDEQKNSSHSTVLESTKKQKKSWSFQKVKCLDSAYELFKEWLQG